MHRIAPDLLAVGNELIPALRRSLYLVGTRSTDIGHKSSKIVPTTARNSVAGSTTEPPYVLFGQIFDLL